MPRRLCRIVRRLQSSRWDLSRMTLWYVVLVLVCSGLFIFTADPHTLLFKSCYANSSSRSRTKEDIRYAYVGITSPLLISLNSIRYGSPASWVGVCALIALVCTFSRGFVFYFPRIKTYEALTAAGIPCTIVLDSAVAYVMDKVDFVLVGL